MKTEEICLTESDIKLWDEDLEYIKVLKAEMFFLRRKINNRERYLVEANKKALELQSKIDKATEMLSKIDFTDTTEYIPPKQIEPIYDLLKRR